MDRSINDTILELRRTYSRSKLAELTGISAGKLYNIEKGRRVSDAEAAAVRRLVEDATPSTTPVVAVELATEPVRRQAPNVTSSSSTTPVAVTVVVVPAVTENTVSPSVLSQLDGFRRVSNSELQTFKDCRRKWYLGWYRGLTLRDRPLVGVRETGDRIHRALKLWYVPEGSPALDPRDALEIVIAEDLATLDKDAHPDAVAEFTKSANLERTVMAGYVEWLAETGSDSEYVVTNSEAYLEAELPGLPGVKIIGRVDVRLRRLIDDVRLFMDHKIVGDLTRPKRTLHLDEQMLHYMLLELLQMDDRPRVAGAVYNMLKRSKRTERANPPFYERVEVHHNPHELASFQRRLIGSITDLELARRRLDEGVDHRLAAYPRPSQDCTWKCDYVVVCPLLDDGSRVESMIEVFFRKHDPFSYYADGQLKGGDK